jgi:hypothetical protein
MTAVLLLAATLGASLDRPAYREVLQRLYDGRAETALAQARELQRDSPEDPLPVYLEALVQCWQLEQHPVPSLLDKEFERTAARAVALADRQLREEPDALEARLARGAAYGVSSRFHLFRGHEREAARAAVRMRQDLLLVRDRDPLSRDALFGLGLYDYYADVLPRLVKVLRFLARIPGGDRERGLSAIEEAGEEPSLHWTEIHAQLYEIYAFYEVKPDLALREIGELHRRYPGWPLWGLKMAEHLRDRMGLYAESAEVARAVAEREERRPPRERGGAAAVLARLSWGESRLRDLRFEETRRAVAPLLVDRGTPDAMRTRAHLLAGLSLERQGDRAAALLEYRQVLEGPDKELRRQAQKAMGSPLPAAEVQALRALAEARRLREGGHERDAGRLYREALAGRPLSREAALGVAEDELREGNVDGARRALHDASDEEERESPWLRPWGWLLEARLHDVAGRRAAAVRLYKKVSEEPYGRAAWREAAEAGLRRPFTPPRPDPRTRPSPSTQNTIQGRQTGG